MKSNVMACIVTYNPEIDRLKKNILSLFEYVEHILIIDNNSNNINEIIELTSSILKKGLHSYIKNEDNIGIADALNQGLNYANKYGYKWLLTLDQDSVLESNMMKVYYNFMNDNKEGLDELAIISPIIINEGEKLKNCFINNSEYIETAITSGSLMNVRIAHKLGGFIGKLFIDLVDFEYCLNARSKGYKIIRLNNAFLYHRLGNIKKHKFINKYIITTNHCSLRRYYYYRNKIYIYKKYFKIYPKWVIKNILSSIKTTLLIILYEENSKEKIIYLIRGIKDGIRDNYGKYTNI